jgi:hypothetical protein
MLHELVEIVIAEDVRRSVADDHVDFFAPEDSLDLIDRFLARDVALNSDDSRDRRYFENIHAD